MSKEEVPVGLAIMEKLFGFLLIIIGGLTFYSTYTNMGSAGALPGLFLTAGAVIMIIGVVLFIAKS